MDLRFAFVCQKKWSELQGSDPIFRFCPDCSRDIVNLDPMTPAAREKFFRDAQRIAMTPCVFATVRDPSLKSCKEPLEDEESEDFPRELGGMPEMDDDVDWGEDVDLDGG